MAAGIGEVPTFCSNTPPTAVGHLEFVGDAGLLAAATSVSDGQIGAVLLGSPLFHEGVHSPQTILPNMIGVPARSVPQMWFPENHKKIDHYLGTIDDMVLGS